MIFSPSPYFVQIRGIIKYYLREGYKLQRCFVDRFVEILNAK